VALHEQTPLALIDDLPRTVVYAVQDWHNWKYPTSHRQVTPKDLCRLSAHDLMENMNPTNGYPPYIGERKLAKVRAVLAANGMTLRYDPPVNTAAPIANRETIAAALRDAQSAIASALHDINR
jgi:hypothetical protein